MSVESNKALVQRQYDEIWNAHNPDAATIFYADDVVDHNQPAPGMPAGVAGARATFATFIGAFPDIRITVDSLVAEDDIVVCRWTSTGTQTGALMMLPPTGRKITVTGIDQFRIADGKIVDRWGSFDQLGLLQQLGAFPLPV